MPESKQGEAVAQNEPAQQPKPKPSSTTAAQANSQASHNEHARNEPGKQAQTRTNEQARQPKPKPNSTTVAQVKNAKTTVSMQGTIQAGTYEN